MKMKKIFIFAMAAVMMAACSKDATEEMLGGKTNGKVANSLLQITTRGTGDAVVAYPVQVYVFQGDECKAVQTIGDAGQTLNIALVEGTYSVYAVGGASSTDYNLPTKDNATTSTALTLKEGRTMTDLMAASATATLGISDADAKAAAVAAAVDAKIAEADVDAISDWRLPTATELNAIYAAQW